MKDEHSNALPMHCYGDPALAYERKESATCRECVHVGHALGWSFCEKGKKQYPRKCAIYREAE